MERKAYTKPEAQLIALNMEESIAASGNPDIPEETEKPGNIFIGDDDIFGILK